MLWAVDTGSSPCFGHTDLKALRRLPEAPILPGPMYLSRTYPLVQYPGALKANLWELLGLYRHYGTPKTLKATNSTTVYTLALIKEFLDTNI